MLAPTKNPSKGSDDVTYPWFLKVTTNYCIWICKHLLSGSRTVFDCACKNYTTFAQSWGTTIHVITVHCMFPKRARRPLDCKSRLIYNVTLCIHSVSVYTYYYHYCHCCHYRYYCNNHSFGITTLTIILYNLYTIGAGITRYLFRKNHRSITVCHASVTWTCSIYLDHPPKWSSSPHSVGYL